jgi:hypothetical protein
MIAMSTDEQYTLEFIYIIHKYPLENRFLFEQIQTEGNIKNKQNTTHDKVIHLYNSPTQKSDTVFLDRLR